MERKPVLINPTDFWFLSDHLAPLSAVLGVPYYLESFEHLEMVKKYYPGVNLLDKETITSQTLLSTFDTIFTPFLFGNPSNNIGVAQNIKKFIFVYCPHGFSNKDPLLIKDGGMDVRVLDIILVYGKHMLDLFKDYQYTECTQNSVMTGNYRYQYYLKNQSFFDDIVENEVFSQFKAKQPVILFAPTWNDGTSASSFFDAVDTIIDNAPDHYNILIKSHPNLVRLNLGHVINAQHRCEKKGNIVLIEDYPLVYPLLNRSDIFVGDVSSVGYDYLKYSRPMFFIHTDKEKTIDDKSLYLYRCGKVIYSDEIPKLFNIIDENLEDHTKSFKKIQKEVYDYTFDKDISFEKINSDILEACERVIVDG